MTSLKCRTFERRQLKFASACKDTLENSWVATQLADTIGTGAR